MRTFKVKDYFGFKEEEIIELENFYTIPERNIAIRKEDYPTTPEELLYDKKYPMFIAITKTTYDAYRCWGEYRPSKLDVTKTILNKRMNLIIQDRYNEDHFFYDTNLLPILRPFQVKLSSQDWHVFELKERISNTKAIFKVEVSEFDPLTGYQILSFYYMPTNSEFTQLYSNCVGFGWSNKMINAYIIDGLDIAEFKR